MCLIPPLDCRLALLAEVSPAPSRGRSMGSHLASMWRRDAHWTRTGSFSLTWARARKPHPLQGFLSGNF